MKSAASAISEEKYRALLSSASKTAGDDSWKTTAGRVDGPDGFVLGDAWRLLKVRFQGASKLPPACPVCLDRPSSDNEWYVTKSCKHAVCRGCLRDYAASLTSDPGHSGPLRCPCCPRLLRVEDARVALDRRRSRVVVHRGSGKSESNGGVATLAGAAIRRESSPTIDRREGRESSLFAGMESVDADDSTGDGSALEFLERWDDKARDAVLRSMADFRPCPHCGGGRKSGERSSGSSDAVHAGDHAGPHNNGGGGFVTTECLAPINGERERNAERLLSMAGNPSSVAILISYLAYYSYCTGRTSARPDRGGHCAVALHVLTAVMPSIVVPILPHAIRLLLATAARREILRPIRVTCPCCLVGFDLDASSEMRDGASPGGDAAAESATWRWKASNTRPCPGCASPIMKDGGCNHVRCGLCRVEFCWACMRSCTSCQAYHCTSGDGTAFPVRAGLDTLERGRRAGHGLIERIDQVEALALRNLSFLPYSQSSTVGIILAASVAYSSSAMLWDCAKRILSLASKNPSFFLVVIFIHSASMSSYNARRRRRNNMWPVIDETRRNPDDIGRRQEQNATLEFIRTFWQPGFVSEDEQIAEVIARSL